MYLIIILKLDKKNYNDIFLLDTITMLFLFILSL